MSLCRAGALSSRIVAVLCVALWMCAVLWMTGGVARADDTSTTAGPSVSDSPPTGNATSADDTDQPTHSPVTSGSAGEADPQDAPAGPDDDENTLPDEEENALPDEDESATAEGESEDGADAARPAKAPRGTRKQSTTLNATAPSAGSPLRGLAAATAETEPAASTDAARELAQNTVSTTAKVSVSTGAAAPLTLALASVSPSATATVPNPVKQVVQFGRQMVGLANDIALLAVTVVQNLAAAAATVIGPRPLWGLPYNIANAVAGTAATAGRLLTGTPWNATSEGPFKVTYGVGNLLDYFNPNKSPAGANEDSVALSAEHPLPVILIHGTAANAPFNWNVGAPVLANAGYKVYTFNYGNITSNPAWPVRGTTDIRESAHELSDFVDQVLSETGADKVILIGHSQGGGLTPTYYINNLDGAEKVSQFIGIAPGHHGVDVNGLAYLQYIPVIGQPLIRLLDLLGPAWRQQALGSSLLDDIYGDGDTRPGVQYTTITSTYDWIVTPYAIQALDGGSNVTNIVLQNQYPGFNAGHLGIVFAKPTWDAVLGALAANADTNVLPEVAAA